MRFRLSTLLLVAPLVGLATFGGLKWYEKLVEQNEIEPHISTMAPVTWGEQAEAHDCVSRKRLWTDSGRAADIAAMI